MEPTPFRIFVTDCTVIPRQLREVLVNRSEQLTPEARARIVRRLQQAEKEQVQILEEGIAGILELQHSMSSLLSEEDSPYRS